MFPEDRPQVSPIFVESEGLWIPLEHLTYQLIALAARQTQRQNRKEETSPPPPYPESSVPSPPASVKIKPEPIKEPFEKPYLLPISETRVLSGVKPGLTKEQKRRNKCMSGWCFTILFVAIALVLGVVGVSVWRLFEDKKSK